MSQANLQICQDVHLKGRYKLQVVKASGEVRQELEFDNLITDAGLDMLGASSITPFYCTVGTGTAPPSPTDTTLTGLITPWPTQIPTNQSPSTVPYKGISTCPAQSPIGGATGTWTEVAIGSGTTVGTFVAFSRALIVDSMGNPTSITVLADEALRVTYILEMIVPTVDVVGTVGPHNFTIRPYRVTLGWVQMSASAGRSALVPISNNQQVIAFSGELQNYTTALSGQLGVGTVTVASYVPGSRELIFTATFNTGNGNGTINTFALVDSRFQMGISPPIVKTNLDVLTVTFKYTWGRAI